MVDTATASAPATREGGGAPGTVYLDQGTYLAAKSDPVQLKKFINDWIKLGGRGIIGGDGKPASYWDVYQDLAHDGIDVSDLPAPESLPQGTVKGGGTATGLASAPPAAPVPTDTTSPEMTTLLRDLGINYENAPAASPGLLAFLRGVQGQMGTAEQARRTAVQQIEDRGTTGRADIERTYGRNQENVTADLIRRGVLQSGEATDRYSRLGEDKAKNLTSLQQTMAEGTSAADNAYNATIDALRSQGMEKVLQREQELAAAKGQSEAQAAATKAAQDAAELAYQRQQAADKAYRDWVEEQARKGQAVG